MYAMDEDHDYDVDVGNNIEELGGWFLFLKYAMPYIAGAVIVLIMLGFTLWFLSYFLSGA